MTCRESSYRGGTYWIGSTDREGEVLIVQANAELEGPIEIAEFPTIVYVEGIERASEFASLIERTSLILIRREGGGGAPKTPGR